ncbi:MAG: hypothetical protein IT229_08125 [Flavobacteriales bacterium]|nr:hypothetical protein [Flavobacteriales bacterium]
MARLLNMNRRTLFLLMLWLPAAAWAQTDTAPPRAEIDASKPTNLYTQVNAQAEATAAPGGDLVGMRFNVQYAFDPNNLLLAEVPLLYNTGTEKFGLADCRMRYFNKFHVNPSARLNALLAGVDMTLPTGSSKNGLGGSAWSIAPTVIAGVMITPKIFAFPGLSYVHVTAPETGIEGVTTYASNGFGVQTNMSISFSKRAFLFVNPIYTWLSSKGSAKDVWNGEFNMNYVVKPSKLKVNAGWFPNFTNEVNTFRLGGTVFL